MKLRFLLFYLVWICFISIACEDEVTPAINKAPTLLPLQEITVEVNQTVSIELFAQDANQDFLQFSFTMNPLPQTSTEGQSAIPTLQTLSKYKAIFQWTPGVADEGVYQLTFSVTDPSNEVDSETMRLSVVSPIRQGVNQMVFVQPQGSGRTINVDTDTCLRDLTVQIKADGIAEDEINITLIEPIPLGLALNPAAVIPGKRKVINWCPSTEQLNREQRYKITIQAEHRSTNRQVNKDFLLNFISPQITDCPGRPPVIEHQVNPLLSGLADYEIRVRVLDDLGIKSAPLLEYIINPPVDPRGQGSDQLEWNLQEFERSFGEEWVSMIPNANLMETDTAIIYYRIIAVDNDDADGARCDHTVQSETYSMQVQGGGDYVTFGWCERCSHSQQCGSNNDLCLILSDGSFCSQACDPQQSASNSCPNQSTCMELILEDNSTSYQCVPTNNRCIDECSSDQFDELSDEDPISIMIATYDTLSICQEEVDFYTVTIPAQQQLQVTATFAQQLDLDLAIALEVDANGQPIYDYGSQQASSSSEQVVLPCQANAVDALIAVYPYEAGNEGEYSLSMNLQNTCQMCVNDDLEQSDSLALEEGVYPSLMICPDDIDEYILDIPASYVLSLLIKFEPSLGNLNARLLNSNGEEIVNTMGRNGGILLEQRIEQGGGYLLQIQGQTSLVSNQYTIDFYKFFAESCTRTMNCPQDTFCYPNLGCLDTLCNQDLSCGFDHECIPPALLAQRDIEGTGACASTCTTNTDCRNNELCKSLPNTHSVCIPTVESTRSIGQSCTQHHECADRLSCIDFSGEGYCFQAACSFNDPCVEGEICVTMETINLCAPLCNTNSCFGGLQCMDIDNEEICLP